MDAVEKCARKVRRTARRLRQALWPALRAPDKDATAWGALARLAEARAQAERIFVGNESRRKAEQAGALANAFAKTFDETGAWSRLGGAALEEALRVDGSVDGDGPDGEKWRRGKLEKWSAAGFPLWLEALKVGADEALWRGGWACLPGWEGAAAAMEAAEELAGLAGAEANAPMLVFLDEMGYYAKGGWGAMAGMARSQGHSMIVGTSGSGKSTLMSSLLRKMQAEREPPRLRGWARRFAAARGPWAEAFAEARPKWAPGSCGLWSKEAWSNPEAAPKLAKLATQVAGAVLDAEGNEGEAAKVVASWAWERFGFWGRSSESVLRLGWMLAFAEAETERGGGRVLRSIEAHLARRGPSVWTPEELAEMERRVLAAGMKPARSSGAGSRI